MNFYIRYLFFCFYLSFVYCAPKYNDNNFKKAIVEEIVEKVTNLTLKQLSNITNPEKTEIFKKIEHKLRDSAKSLGPNAEKYVNLLMKGIKIKGFNNNINPHNKLFPLRHGKYLRIRQNRTEEPKSKEQLVQEIAKKIEMLAKDSLKNANTNEDRQKIIQKIKDKIMETANKKHNLIHNKHKEIKSYSDIIARGVELVLKNLMNTTRRLSEDNSIDVNYLPHTKEDEEELLRKNDIDLIHKNSLENSTLSLTTESNCFVIVPKVCSKIKFLNEFRCRYDSSVKSLEKLCNGVPDCPDGSDETDCAAQAVERVRNSTHLIMEIESSLMKKCFKTNIDKTLLRTQNSILRNVLQVQARFIQSYTVNSKQDSDEADAKRTVKDAVNGISTVISTLAFALDSALCPSQLRNKQVEDIARKFGDIIDEEMEDELNDQKPPRLCVCSEQFCVGARCTDACKHVCWHKYSLLRWSCQAVDGTATIPLDLICDGKLDCYDETDENGCNTGSLSKFEATNMFDNILKVLTTKTKSAEYSPAYNKLTSFYSSIKQLQKHATNKNKPDVLYIKNLREQCFSSLNEIYEAVLSKANGVNEMKEVYTFLISINEKLVTALKRTHTGNDRIISPDGCFCRNGACALTTCSKRCVRACSVEPKLTRYICGNDNTSVPVEAVCNGKKNCPNEEDEADCQTAEICRSHHLMVLRHKIKDVGKKQKGTALGEVLKTWKMKVTATLMIAENNGRPKPIMIRDTVSDILRDLVTTYASMDEFRRINDDYVLEEFLQISQFVIETVKSCGK